MADDIEPTRPAGLEKSKKIPAALLAFFLGFLGAHKFYLGYTKAGVLQILSNIACFAGSFIALAEFIIYLTKSDDDFVRIYQDGKKEWF